MGISMRSPPWLEANIEAKIEPEPNTGCWLWTGTLNGRGYGLIKFDGRNIYAHRYVFERLVGPIPPGLELDHLCKVHCCVNPTHLEPTTHRENCLRGVSFSAINARKTTCHNGHPLSGDNLVQSALRRGGRTCRICWNAYYREWLRRKRIQPRHDIKT